MARELIEMTKERNSHDHSGEQDSQKTLAVSEIYRSVLRDYPDVLDVNQVSAILGVSTKTVYRLVNDGALSSLKVGRAFKVPKLYVLQYLKVLAPC